MCRGWRRREREVLLAEARAVAGPAPAEAVSRELDYLERNRPRMDYRRYREQGWFIGSGVVEAGCQRVIGQRLKQSGMFWREAGATAVANSRCALLSAGGWDHLWRQPLLQAARSLSRDFLAPHPASSATWRGGLARALTPAFKLDRHHKRGAGGLSGSTNGSTPLAFVLRLQSLSPQ